MSENAEHDPVGRAIPELVDEIGRLRAHVEAVEGRNDNLVAELRSLRAELAEKDKRIEELEAEVDLHIKAQQSKPMIWHHVDGGWVWSNCPECGPNVRIDEDGCCVGCGRDALWYGEQEPAYV